METGKRLEEQKRRFRSGEDSKLIVLKDGIMTNFTAPNIPRGSMQPAALRPVSNGDPCSEKARWGYVISIETIVIGDFS